MRMKFGVLFCIRNNSYSSLSENLHTLRHHKSYKAFTMTEFIYEKMNRRWGTRCKKPSRKRLLWKAREISYLNFRPVHNLTSLFGGQYSRKAASSFLRSGSERAFLDVFSTNASYIFIFSEIATWYSKRPCLTAFTLDWTHHILEPDLMRK